MNNKVNFPCPICGSINIKPIYSDTLGDSFPAFGYNFSSKHNLNYQLVSCKDCSHHFSSPRHINIYQQYQDIADDAYLANKDDYLDTFKKNINTILRYKNEGN